MKANWKWESTEAELVTNTTLEVMEFQLVQNSFSLLPKLENNESLKQRIC